MQGPIPEQDGGGGGRARQGSMLWYGLLMAGYGIWNLALLPFRMASALGHQPWPLVRGNPSWTWFMTLGLPWGTATIVVFGPILTIGFAGLIGAGAGLVFRWKHCLKTSLVALAIMWGHELFELPYSIASALGWVQVIPYRMAQHYGIEKGGSVPEAVTAALRGAGVRECFAMVCHIGIFYLLWLAMSRMPSSTKLGET
jgi:hypothetical protein